MSARNFALSLLGFTLTWAALLAAIASLFPGAHAAWQMSVAASGLFVVVCIAMYIAGRIAVQSANKNAFIGVVFISVFGKMLLSMGLLFAYRIILQPTGKWFVGLFLLCYAAYTIFEVWFLYRLAKAK